MKHYIDPELSQRITHAGSEIFALVIRSLADGRGVHLETALAAAGYLAGAAILRNCGVDLATFAPGTPIFVDAANEVGPEVVNHMMGLIAGGQQTGERDLKSPLAESVPEMNQPLRTYGDLLSLLWPQFEQATAKHFIPPEFAAYAAATAAAKFVVEGQMMLDPAIAKAIALEAIVKAAKTVPAMPLAA